MEPAPTTRASTRLELAARFATKGLLAWDEVRCNSLPMFGFCSGYLPLGFFAEVSFLFALHLISGGFFISSQSASHFDRVETSGVDLIYPPPEGTLQSELGLSAEETSWKDITPLKCVCVRACVRVSLCV